MKCVQCGGTMVASRENVNYRASGLPNVTLLNLEVRRCPECGDRQTVIPDIEGLHRLLAKAIVGKPSRLTPDEIRFLRKSLGWSSADFARRMGVTPESVSRWENGRERMGATAERLLRLMVVHSSPVSDYSLDTLADLRDEAVPVRLRVAPAKSGWRRQQSAA